ncbi:MAG: 23S rRNA (guanosine(2251)-2'-O)-methyltransferase RlmB [Sulfurimonas sp.]|nr:MAG: 23S rRNA (guanosine(2251)-2'-O)-methyltransferase RlmB [Sulfurimonas sp.]
MKDSPEYLQKKAFVERLMTFYGRNVAVELLEDPNITVHKVHLSDANRMEGIVKKIIRLAQERDVTIAYHDKAALSRISKNAKHDQGVAVDVLSQRYLHVNFITESFAKGYRLLALEGIHNPQNLGMIIRSAAAGKIDGIILPKKNSAKLSALVMKASAGTLFKIDIFYCDTLLSALTSLVKEAEIFALSSHARKSLETLSLPKRSIFVLGNESEGVSAELLSLCHESIAIPMNRGVESLNVAVTAALIAFKA